MQIKLNKDLSVILQEEIVKPKKQLFHVTVTTRTKSKINGFSNPLCLTVKYKQNN